MSPTSWKLGKFFKGTKGDDVLTGTDRSDALFGNRGADVLHAGGGADYLDGGAGDDILHGGAGRDTLKGGRGNDTLDGGDGLDTAIFSGRLSDYRIERDEGGGVRITDMRAGKDGSDLLVDIEKVCFADGFHTLADLLPQGVVLTGTDADELLTGTAYDDQMTGGLGYDTLIGGTGNDFLSGDGDFADYSTDELVGGAGNDTLVGSSEDIFDGGDGFDTLRMPESNGVFVASDANFRGVEAVELGGFSAYFDASALQTGLQISSTASNGLIGGSQAADQITVNGGHNVFGGGGNDTIVSGVGGDNLDGGDGDDVLVGGQGFNAFTGGAGSDRFVLDTTKTDADAIVDFAKGEDVIDLRGQGRSFGDLSVSAAFGDTAVSIGSYTVYLAGPVEITEDMFMF